LPRGWPGRKAFYFHGNGFALDGDFHRRVGQVAHADSKPSFPNFNSEGSCHQRRPLLVRDRNCSRRPWERHKLDSGALEPTERDFLSNSATATAMAATVSRSDLSFPIVSKSPLLPCRRLSTVRISRDGSQLRFNL
jgi:hypothetical protein